MKCPECQAENPEGAKFCMACGARLVLVCAACRTELPPGAKFCLACGTRLDPSPGELEQEPDEKGIDKAIQRLIPEAYAERLLATRGQVQPQRRIVTVLFSDVKGYTEMAEALDPEDVMEIMDGAFDVLIEPIYRYEGTLARLMGDAVLAFFGAPIAHEDDPERACRAGLEIVEGTQAYAERLEREWGIKGFNVRVGINTGLVVVGEVGSDLRVEYTATGDAINLAARMEGAAEPGTVLITEATHKLIAPLFETEALGPIEVKGKAEPVSVYRVLAAKAVRGIAGLASPLVGREAEFAALAAALERLGAGVGGIVTLVGEAGIGKSRLVAEVRKHNPVRVTEPEGSRDSSQVLAAPRWVEGRCLSYSSSIAYLLWLDVLRGLLGVTAEDAPAEVRDVLRERVEALCADCFDQVYPYLGRLMSLPLQEEAQALLEGLEPRRLKANTFRALETMLQRAADAHPLVVVCEDLHWADPTSLEVLEQSLGLTDRAPLLLVSVFRPRTDHGSWRIKETAARDYRHRHTDLWLDPLSAGESEALVGNLLPLEDLPPKLTWRILSHAEGNPFYVEEIIRSLISEGAILEDEATGRWQATREVAEIRIPDTVQGVLTARIDRLQEETRRVLQMAAVIGRIFLYRVLAAIAEEERELGERLLTLQREEMIRERARLPELEYIFKHELTREAAYNGLLKRERRAFHRQVAEALEGLFLEWVDEQAGLLAHHWERAEVPERAIYYLHQAGEQARGQYANEQAIDYFQRALALLEDGLSDEFRQDMAVRLYEGLGDVLEWTGHHHEARSAYQDALTSVRADDRIGQGQLYRKMGWTWESQHWPEDSLRAYDAADAALGEEPAEPAAAWWREWLAIQLSRMDAHYFQVDWRKSMEVAERIRPVVERYGTPRERSWFFNALVSANNTRDRFHVSEETVAHCRANVEAAQQSGSIARLAGARFFLGFNLLWYGDTDGAKEQLETAQELALRVGDMLVQTRCLNYLAVACRKCGQVEETEGYALRTHEAAVALENLSYIRAARANLAWVAWREGDRTRALEHGRAVLELAQRQGRGPFQWMWLCPLIAVALADDRISDAVEYAAGLVEPTQQRLPDTLETTIEGAIGAWERGKAEQARSHLERAVEEAREVGYL